MFDLDLSQPHVFLLMVIFMFAVIVLRYFFIAGFFFMVFHKWSGKWEKRKVNTKNYSRKQFVNEVKWSVVTASIFAFTGALTALA